MKPCAFLLRCLACLPAVVPAVVPAVAAAEPFPGDGDAVLVLSNATWWAGKPEEPRDVALRLQRFDGKKVLFE